VLAADFFGAVDHTPIWNLISVRQLILGVKNLGVLAAFVLGLQLGLDDVLRVREEPAGEAANASGDEQLVEA